MSSGAVTGLIILVVAAIAMVVTFAIGYGRRTEQRRSAQVDWFADDFADDGDEVFERHEMAGRNGPRPGY
jgi:hypothetical protein